MPHRKDEEIQATGERAVRTKDTHKKYHDISNSICSVEFYGYTDICIKIARWMDGWMDRQIDK